MHEQYNLMNSPDFAKKRKHLEYGKRAQGNLNGQESPRMARKRIPHFDQSKQSTEI